MEDEQIIDLFFHRSEQAITELSQKYGSMCRRVAWNILNDRLDVEECVNDAYLAVWDKIPPQRPSPLPAYLCRVVRNLSVKRYHTNTAAKRNSFYDAALDELAECVPGPETVEGSYDGHELAAAINAFLDAQSRENRTLFVRRYWFSDSIPDLAARYGMSNHNVTVRLSRIRGKLKQYLEQEGIWP